LARKWGLLMIALGVITFLVRARVSREWPFAAPRSAQESA